VLAAVAILGIAYITLGSSGIQGLQHEGEARRRFQASLLADSVLSEIEAGLEAGVAPPIGTDEREADDFKIEVEIAPFSIVVPEEEGEGGKRLGNARSRLGGERSTCASSGTKASASARCRAPPLRSIARPQAPRSKRSPSRKPPPGVNSSSPPRRTRSVAANRARSERPNERSKPSAGGDRTQRAPHLRSPPPRFPRSKPTASGDITS
jgi:hypothetical protein